MLTQEEDVEAHSLRRRGWTISAIARHLGCDRKTVRAYLAGDRRPGKRQPAGDDAFALFVDYVRIRLRDDPHVWGTTLYDEVHGLGYERSYQRFTAELRARDLRPVCADCMSARSRVTIEIDHPAGEEIQWDWLALPDAPWGGDAHLLNGTLSYSGRTRGVFAESEEQPHLIEAIDGVLRRLGGTAIRWRIDRMSTAVDIKTGDLLSSFAAVARYYGVAVAVCPPRRARRKGKVEKNNDYSAQRWWRTAPVSTLEEAQQGYDRFCVETGDVRPRGTGTVADLACDEHLQGLPDGPYPAVIEDGRKVGDSSLVPFRGNSYSIFSGLEGEAVVVRHRLGTEVLEIVSPVGVILASHRLEPAGSGAIVRLPEHRVAQEAAVLAAFGTGRRCRRKVHRPPSADALAAAARIRPPLMKEVVVDLRAYAELTGGGQ